jgi:putative endonuclease
MIPAGSRRPVIDVPEWFVYILRCADGTLYTGITTDPERRVHEHNHLKSAAAYTRARRPVCLVYSESCASRADAARREYAIRRLDRKAKTSLVMQRER